MTTTNIILLKALNREQFKPIKEIQADLKLLGVNLSQKNIYARLENLAKKKLSPTMARRLENLRAIKNRRMGIRFI